jgi:hypothetical protein
MRNKPFPFTMLVFLMMFVVVLSIAIPSVDNIILALGVSGVVVLLVSPFFVGFVVFAKLRVAIENKLEAVGEGVANQNEDIYKVTYKLERPGTDELTQGEGYVDVYPKYVTVGDFSFNQHNIRWLGDRSGRDEVLLDLDMDGRWFTLTINAGKSAKALVDDLRELTPVHIDTARNRRRPNRRYPPIHAFTTTQNLQGFWHNHEAVRLSLTPLWLVVLQQDRVVNIIAIDDVQNVRCIKHPTALDDAVLLLQFDTTENEQFAFSITDATFPEQLAQVTQEAIDDVPLQKRKHEESDLT